MTAKTNKEILESIEMKLDKYNDSIQALIEAIVNRNIKRTEEQLEDSLEAEDSLEEPTETIVKETKNYLECYHVFKDGKIVETPKSYLMKPTLNATKGRFIAKSTIKTLSYPNNTSNDAVRVIFEDKFSWIVEKIIWDRDIQR